MKAVFKCFLLLLCTILLCLPVCAVSCVETERTSAVVESGGSCRVEIWLQVRLEDTQSLTFPLPKNAKNVRLDGVLKTPSVQGDRLMLSLGTHTVGVHTFSVGFTLADIITEDGEALTAQIPLLTGFALPLESFSFSVTLPGTLAQTPQFSCNWGESEISKLTLTVSDNTVSGTATEKLLDSTQLYLLCAGDHTLFSAFSSDTSPLGSWEMLLAVLVVVGILYYLIALLPSYPRKVRSFSPPEGLAAGDIGTCLTGCGMDLTMMVFSWAQLGYLSIHVDAREHVRLQKRMDMGSERSDFENNVFRKLFSGRRTVDGASLHYALLCRKVATKSPLLRQIYRSRSGNPKIVGALAVAAGACSGILLAQSVYTAGAMTVLLAIALAALCAILSHAIQSGGRCAPLGNKSPIRIGLICAVAWPILGYLCGNMRLAVLMVLYESLVGFATAVGGRRSELGQQYLAQIRGLRAHLTRGSVFDIQQCLARNPSYFFEMLPYALALGVEKRFARRFGKARLAQCDYLSADGRENLTTTQWAALLRQTADSLNRRQGRLRYERFFRRRPAENRNRHEHDGHRPSPFDN